MNVMESIISNINDSYSERKSSKYAYVTLVMRGDRYVPGAIALAYSLRKHHTKHQIICMVTNDVSTDALYKLSVAFDVIVNVPFISHTAPPMRNPKLEKRYGKWKCVSYTKWNVLNLTWYEKVLFLDADTIVLNNIDHLFELRAPAATFSMAQASRGYGKLSSPYNAGHGGVISSEELKNGFSSFVGIGSTMLLKTSNAHLRLYKKWLYDDKLRGSSRCINGPDEQSIVLFYSLINHRWTHIHQAYNMIPWHSKTWLARKGKYSRPFVYHYVSGNEKPWELFDKQAEWPDLKTWFQLAGEAQTYFGITF